MNTRKAEFAAEFARLAEDLAKRDAVLDKRFSDLGEQQARRDAALDKRFAESAAAASKRETRYILSSVGVTIGSVAIAATALGILIAAN